jgi:hypothetical protein
MKLSAFEALVARAEYRFMKCCKMDDGSERRIYVTTRRGPKINVLCYTTDDGMEVDELHALTVEAMLDEEDDFED